jgi:hypothetical protein
MSLFNRAFVSLALYCAAIVPLVARAQNYSDIWWNPDESGWGLTLADHDTQLFGVWYTYAADGRPTWYVIPGGTFTQGKRLFSADIYRTTGPAYNAPFDSSLVTVTKVGTSHFDFSPPGLAPGTALFSYTLGSVSHTKQIQRQPFGNAATHWGTDFTDIWWNPNESGWGLTLAQHGNNVFGVWFTYDTSGNPLWMVLPGVTFNGNNSFSGSLYTTTGPYFASVPFNPANVVVTRVGTASITLNGRGGAFTSTVNGFVQTKPTTGQPFGTPPPPSPGSSPYAGTWLVKDKVRTLGNPPCGETAADIGVERVQGFFVVDGNGNFFMMDREFPALLGMTGTISTNGNIAMTLYGDSLRTQGNCPAGSASGTMTDVNNGSGAYSQAGGTGTITFTRVSG